MYTKTNKQAEIMASSKYDTLQNYRQYLQKEMDCLKLEVEKDEAELDLLQLNICQSIMALTEKRDSMVKEFQRLEGQYISEKQYSLEMEAENVSTILHLKENYRVQEDLRRQQRSLREAAHQLMKQTHLLKAEVDPNNMEAGVYGRSAELQLQIKEWRNKENEAKETSRQYLEEENIKIKNIKQIQEKMSNLRSEIERFQLLQEEKQQEYQINLKEKNQKEQEKIVKQTLLQELLKCKQEAEKKQSRSLKISSDLHHEGNKLGHELAVALKDLQFEERGRESDEQKLKKQIVHREKNKELLSSLLQYLEELEDANQNYTEILQNQQEENRNIGKALRINIGTNNSQGMNQQMNKRPESPSKTREEHAKSIEKQNLYQQNRPKRSLTSSTWNTGFRNHERLKIN